MWVGKCLIELISHFPYFYFTTQRQSNLTSGCQPCDARRPSSQLFKASALLILHYNGSHFRKEMNGGGISGTPVQWMAQSPAEGCTAMTLKAYCSIIRHLRGRKANDS